MTTVIATIKSTPNTVDKIIHNNSSESSSLRELGPTLVGESAKKNEMILNIDCQEITNNAASAEN